MQLPLALVMGADLCHGDEIAACHEAEKTRDESAAVAAACARACELKDGYGCMAAGFLYGKGKSVPRDFARASELLKAGCDLADGVSCYFLAYNRSQGNGAPQDLPQAAELYSRACGFGVPSACQLLGEMQEQGRGVEQDMKAALASYRKA